MVIRTEVTPYQGPPAPDHLRERFPRMLEYLDSLPAGLHSYPQCQARAAILQTFVEVGPKLGADADPFIARLLLPPPRGFVTEVVQNAGFLAIADGAGMTERQYLDFCHAGNRALFTGLLYRALMSLFSPATLLERAPARWESFHPGTRLTISGDGPSVARLTFPPYLYSPLLLRGVGQAFAVAVEMARGREASVELTAYEATEGTFLATWR